MPPRGAYERVAEVRESHVAPSAESTADASFAWSSLYDSRDFHVSIVMPLDA